MSFSSHPEIARWQSAQTLHRVAHEGRTVCWHQFGQGAPLVLLHGGHGNWMHWIRNIEALARQHTLLIPDLPGFGESDELAHDPHAPDRIEALVRAVLASLNALTGDHAPIDLAGFSFGGLVAAQLAARRSHVRRLALLGTAGHGGARREKAPMVNCRVGERAERLAGLRHNLRVFMLHDEGQMDDLSLAVHETACVQTRFRSKALSRSGQIQPVLATLAAPTLLLWGEHDVTAQPDIVGPQLAASHPAHQWRVIPDAGHWVQYEQAQETNRVLQNWFAPDD